MWAKKKLLMMGITCVVVLTAFVYLFINTTRQIKNDIFPNINQIITNNFVGDGYIFDITSLNNTLIKINKNVQTIDKWINKFYITKKLVKNEYLVKLDLLSTNLPDVIEVLDNLTKNNQKIIVMFQNSDEIRATGGFMGSYAIVNIENGKITEINIEDIYDVDGQFNGFIEAPNGVKEYLSSNKGLRVSDANWYPDFPTSSKQILQFFALGNKKNISTLIAVNLDYAKTIINIFGDITLKDYNTIVNSNNINEVLRSRRDSFFPGSKQKKHLLSQLLTQLQIKFIDAPEATKLEIVQQSYNQLKINNIQFYSTDSEIDKIFSKHDFRQELEYKNDSNYIYLVESNVGINKANKNITRKVDLTINKFHTWITAEFKNNNAPPSESILTGLVGTNGTEEIESLGYVDYQRIIVEPSQELVSIKYNNQLIDKWNENIIKNTKGEEFKEIGFLITLKEKEISLLEIELLNNQENKNKIFVQKQPGLPPTPYTIKKDEFISLGLLENDFLFELNKML